MTEKEASTLVLILRTAFSNERWDGATTKFWEGRMQRLDSPSVAYDVIEKVIDSYERRPAWAQLRDAYFSEVKRRSEKAAEGRMIEGIPRDFGIPSWVYVWTWARSHRDPLLDPDVRLPQQDWNSALEPTHRELRTMSEDEYDKLHDEWIEAGAPRPDPYAKLRA